VRVRSPSLLACLTVPLIGAAEPMPSSAPDDPDLKLDGTCRGGPSAKELRAAVPRRVPELVVLWPRVGATRDGPCLPVGRVTVVDHQGLLLTVSFVVHGDASPPDAGFRPWFPDEGEAAEGPGRSGPPRNEFVWIPEEAPGLHVILAGSPSTSHDTLEGATGFLAGEDVLNALAALAR
jgi:hypothetical protein